MNIQFLSETQNPLASPETPLFEKVKAEILKRPDCVEVFGAEKADAVILQEPVSFKEWRYISKLLADPIVGKYPHKIYTINTDDGATGLLRGIYTCLPSNRFDPLLHRAVPYASSPIEAFFLRERERSHSPEFLGSWRGNLKWNRLRGQLLQVLENHPRFKIEASENWFNHPDNEKKHYVELLLSAKFSLCPAGWAAATYRIYESMALGVSPVIIADFFVPPQGADWSSFSIRVPEKSVSELESILTRMENQYVEMGRRAREAWERYFSPPAVFGYYADSLIECINSGGTRSRKTELERWRSFRMYWTNRWTLPQRLTIKLSKLTSR